MIGLNDLYDLFDLFKLLEQKCSLFTHKRFELFKFLSSQLKRYYHHKVKKSRKLLILLILLILRISFIL